MAKALAATTAARRAVAADRAETAAGCFDGRFRSEVSRALVRLSEGESCCIEKIQDEDAREALEHVLRGLGLRPAPRDELAGAPGFAADDACSQGSPRWPSMRPAAVAAPPVAAEAATRGGRRAPRGPRPPAPRAGGPARPPPESLSSDDDGPARAPARRAPRRPTKRVKVDEDKHGGWTRAADGTKGDCDGKRGRMLTRRRPANSRR